MNNKNPSLLLIFLSGTLFLALYVLLAVNNRLPYEDYNFLFLSQKLGPVNAMIDVYRHYSARWSAHTLGFYFSAYFEWRYFLLLFNLITLGTLMTGIFLLLKKILRELFSFGISTPALLAYTLLFTTCFFLSAYNIGEVWFWYMVSWMYMWSIIAGNFLFLILISGKLRSVYIPAIILLAAYIAGAAESYAAVYIVLLITLLILKQRNILPALSKHFDNATLLIALISLSILYLITVFAPGTAARKAMLTDASLTEHIIMCFKAYGIVIIKKTPFVLPPLILFSLPWILLGKELESKDKTEIKKVIPIFSKSILLIGGIISILILPASWVLYDPPPDRALSQVSLLACVFSAFIFFYLGYKIKVTQNIIPAITLTSLLAGILLIAFHLQEQYNITGNYSREYDNRIKLVKQESSNGAAKILWLEALPSSGMLYSDRLYSDSTARDGFENIFCPGIQVAEKDTGHAGK